MIKSKSAQPPYRTHFTNGLHEAYADTTEDKGGAGSGFRPHDLLEAALSTCLNMEVKIFAEHHNIPLSEVHTEVRLDRSHPDETIFKYSVEIVGPLSDDQRQKLIRAAKACSVHKTLSKKLSFENLNEK